MGPLATLVRPRECFLTVGGTPLESGQPDSVARASRPRLATGRGSEDIDLPSVRDSWWGGAGTAALLR